MAELLSPNLAIAASAGSGKTFALAHRYIGLLLQGARPERIVALTFSRKAAGEIFDSIVGYLLEAAASDRAARTVGERLGLALDQKRATGLLRLLLGRLHRLQTGTLDSFAVRVLRCFPLEFGVGTEFRILDDNEASRQLVLLAALRRYLAELAPETRGAFFDAFRRASFGEAPRRFTDELLAFVADCHDLYLDHPDADAWGLGDRLWPHPPAWRAAAPPGEEQRQRFLDLLQNVDLPGKVRAAFARFCQALPEWRPAMAPDRGISYILERLPADALVADKGVLCMYGREVELRGEAWSLLQGFVGWMLGREVAAQNERLRAIHAIMAGYEEVYDRLFRLRGLLAFDDVHRLVRAGLRRSDAAERLVFRLDTRFDHWLLDEFQDTSRLQWEALQPLVDECIQDPERTFFYVGDVKQAIYAWRRGDARIFNEILAHYGEFGRLDLDVSYRSVQPIVEAVNQVFARVDGMDLPEEAARRWRETWRPHRSARDPAEAGCALLLEVESESGGRGAARGQEERFQAVGVLLRRIDPLRRGLSAAVLVRANKTASALADFLRQAHPDLPVRLEGVSRLDDTPLLPVLLALIRFACHPKDGFSRGLLAMSPLAGRLEEMGYDVAASQVRRQIATHGFRACLEEWAAHLPLDSFGQRRLAEMLQAADRFDLVGERDADAFVAAMRAYTSRQEGGADAVRIMTVHQAKGLGFDVVVLPELQGRSMDVVDAAIVRRWAGCCVGRVHKPFARLDPVLASIDEAVRAEAAYEALCLLYVAMTRAKRGLYLVTSTPAGSSTVRDYAALLRLALAREGAEEGERPACELDGVAAKQLFVAGDPHWYRTVRLAADWPRTEKRPPLWRPRPAGRRPRPVAPSSVAEEQLRAAELLGPAAQERLDLGTAVHQIFEQVRWLDEIGDMERFLDAWRQTAPFAPEILDQAAAHFLRAVAAAEIAAVLRRPASPVRLWREKPFDVFLDGQRVTGVFDRVEISGPMERPVAARIFDYKTNRLAGEQEIAAACDRYRPQLALYRRALAALLALAEERIVCTLVFTHCGVVRDLASETGPGLPSRSSTGAR